MSELRQNFATREWVVIATERARRPEEMAHHRERKPLASFVPSCPFCPGNEKLTPPAGSAEGTGLAGRSVARARDPE
jgi:UDPglucose--hexose-1-phosphate uridylyltransferase